MKISEISLSNVKCFDKYVLDLHKPDTTEPLSVCALVGTNGSGKSTILKSIVAAFTTLYNGYNGEVFDDNAVRKGSNSLQVNIKLKLSEEENARVNKDNSITEIVYNHTKKTPADTTSFNHLYFPFDTTKDKSGEKKMAQYKQFLTDFINSNKDGLILYFDTFRFLVNNNPVGPNFMDNISDAKINALASNINKDGCMSEKGFNIKQWFINLDYSILKNPTDNNQLIYSHMKQAFELLLHPLIFGNINKEGNIIFEDKKSNKMIEIDMLSDGFKSIFIIITEIIFRLSFLAEDDIPFYRKEAIVIIDEIDCHIHPRWQKSLIPSLKKLFPNCQFIVTTHSPFILESLQEYEIIKIGDKEIL